MGLDHDNLKTIRESISIIGDIDIIEKNRGKNFENFLNNLMKYVRSSSSSIIISSINNIGKSFLLQLIEKNIEENPYYSEKDKNYNSIKLIKIDSKENLVKFGFF